MMCLLLLEFVICVCVSSRCKIIFYVCFFFFKQKTAYEMRISDWSSDVCSSDLHHRVAARDLVGREHGGARQLDQLHAVRGERRQVVARIGRLAVGPGEVGTEADAEGGHRGSLGSSPSASIHRVAPPPPSHDYARWRSRRMSWAQKRRWRSARRSVG